MKSKENQTNQMDTNSQQKEKNPPLYKIVDKLFHGVMDRKFVPQYFKDRPGLSAAVLGTVGTATLVGGTQFVTKNWMPVFYTADLPMIEAAGLGILTGGLLYYSDKISKWSKEHPVYTPGMAASIVTAYALTITDFL